MDRHGALATEFLSSHGHDHGASTKAMRLQISESFAVLSFNSAAAAGMLMRAAAGGQVN